MHGTHSSPPPSAPKTRISPPTSGLCEDIIRTWYRCATEAIPSTVSPNLNVSHFIGSIQSFSAQPISPLFLTQLNPEHPTNSYINGWGFNNGYI
jgi:hypothetical protein